MFQHRRCPTGIGNLAVTCNPPGVVSHPQECYSAIKHDPHIYLLLLKSSLTLVVLFCTVSLSFPVIIVLSFFLSSSSLRVRIRYGDASSPPSSPALLLVPLASSVCLRHVLQGCCGCHDSWRAVAALASGVNSQTEESKMPVLRWSSDPKRGAISLSPSLPPVLLGRLSSSFS